MIKLKNSRDCLVCGMQNAHGLRAAFFRIQEGQVICHVTIPEWFQDYPGFAHCGIITGILNETSGRTFMTEEDTHDAFKVAAESRVIFAGPIPVGQPLVCEARQMRSPADAREGWVMARGWLCDTDRRKLAYATVVLAPLPPNLLSGDPERDHGWKVYPD